MLKRSITGFFIILVTAGFVALRLVSVCFFDAFTLAILYGALFEIVLASKKANQKINIVVLVVYPILLACSYIFSSNLQMALLLNIASLLFMFMVLMITELVQNAVIRKHGNKQQDEEKLNASLLSQTKNTFQILIYPATILGGLFGINHLGLNVGFVAIITVIMVTMLTDVFAYLFGCMIGGPKMCPEISPKKTIAGMVFGIAGGLLGAFLAWLMFAHFGWFDALGHLSVAVKIILFVLCGLFGTILTQCGDLVASAYKRKVGIKDFGKIFPGHGGIMDRVDGLMFTSVLVFVIFALFA